MVGVHTLIGIGEAAITFLAVAASCGPSRPGVRRSAGLDSRELVVKEAVA